MACLNTETKSALVDKIEHSNIPSSEAQILAEFIEEMPVCTIEDTKKSKRGKRPLSKYNLHMSSCLKTGTMIDCVKIWKKIKTGKNI